MYTGLRTILVPTDFSPKAKNALKLAATMATRHKAKLVVMHAVQTHYMTDRGGKHLIAGQTAQQNLENATASLEKLHEFLSQTYNLDVETVISAQGLIESINQLVRSHDIDLVVVGTGGRQSVKEFFLGSNSYSAMLHSHCSVLLVPQDFEKTAFEKILFPVRVENELEQKAELSLLLAQKNNAGINLLGVGDSDRVAAVRKAYIEARKQLMLKSADYVSEFRLCDDNANAIIEVAQDDESDIILLADQDENSWKSFMGENFFRKIINGTNVPLLIVKPKLLKDREEDIAGFDVTLPVHG